MLTDEQLLALIPSRQKILLASAIGKRLVEVERFFPCDLACFVARGNEENAFFSRNSGGTCLFFEGDIVHPLSVWGEQLSLVVLPDRFTNNDYATLFKLSQTSAVFPAFPNVLGKVCVDVRIWKLHEDFEAEEARECAISYVLTDGAELFYTIYLHEDGDGDYLMLRPEVDTSKAESVFSLAQGSRLNAGSL